MGGPAGTTDAELNPNFRIARSKLGAAAHPEALRRLFELWPDAVVRVRHDETWRGDRRTTVYLSLDSEHPLVTKSGSATCHSSDRYDRKYGLSLAFRRALKRVATETS